MIYERIKQDNPKPPRILFYMIIISKSVDATVAIRLFIFLSEINSFMPYCRNVLLMFLWITFVAAKVITMIYKEEKRTLMLQYIGMLFFIALPFPSHTSISTVQSVDIGVKIAFTQPTNFNL